MTHVTDTNYTYVAAKKILDACYKADSSATVRGNFEVHGSIIHAKISAQKKVPGFEQGYNVEITSSVLSAATIRDIIANAIN